MGLFKWVERVSTISVDCAALGRKTVAMRVPAGIAIPDGCVGLIMRGGHTRRVAEGARVVLGEGELASCFHPGPYSVDLTPFAAAPELGLSLVFVVNTPDPRVAQQRFDLFLASEASEKLDLSALVPMLEKVLQHELAQGNLDLPPGTTPLEWTHFRAGLNQLMYTRFGITIDDCIPVDLGQTVDYGAALVARAALPALQVVVPPATEAAAVTGNVAGVDARALRRLFLELPSVMHGLRMAVLPSGQALFRQHQQLLQRLDQVNLAVDTMPSLGWAAPGQPLAADSQARRASHSQRAVVALDDAWSLLARLALAELDELPGMFDEAERIIANLEHDCAQRRIV